MFNLILSVGSFIQTLLFSTKGNIKSNAWRRLPFAISEVQRFLGSGHAPTLKATAARGCREQGYSFTESWRQLAVARLIKQKGLTLALEASA